MTVYCSPMCLSPINLLIFRRNHKLSNQNDFDVHIQFDAGCAKCNIGYDYKCGLTVSNKHLLSFDSWKKQQIKGMTFSTCETSSFISLQLGIHQHVITCPLAEDFKMKVEREYYVYWQVQCTLCAVVLADLCGAVFRLLT